jgi:hypothetical protein
MRIFVTTEARAMRVFRHARCFNSCSVLDKLIRCPPELARLIEAGKETCIGWIDNRKIFERREIDSHFLVLTNRSVYDINNDSISQVRLADLKAVSWSGSKDDFVNGGKLLLTLANGEIVDLEVNFFDRYGAFLFTMMRFLLNITADNKYNPVQEKGANELS